MKRFFLVIITALLLLSCGESDTTKTPAAAPTMDDIVGLWDASTLYTDGIIDIVYLEIMADGKQIEFDYVGDNYEDGPPCYWKDEYTITNEGDGNFVITGEDSVQHVNVTLSGDNLLIKVDNFSKTLTPVVDPIKDLAKLCYN